MKLFDREMRISIWRPGQTNIILSYIRKFSPRKSGKCAVVRCLIRCLITTTHYDSCCYIEYKDCENIEFLYGALGQAT